jgi:serine/threonine-protein kinase
MAEDDTFELNLRTGAAPEVPTAPTTGEFTRVEDGRRTTKVEKRFAPGTLIAGRYRVVEMLGRGGMGEVYRAEDLRLGEDVALKFLSPELADNPGRRARLVAEAKVARKLTHANLCRVHDFVEADGLWFLSMEFVEGEDLGALLQRIGRLSPEKALDVAQQLCLGLAAAHERGVLHRDLKPANVMLDVNGRVRLMDFGLAAFASEIAADDTRSGTPRYMAPEQLDGAEVTFKSDLFSLGIVLHEIFVGRRPAPDYVSQTGLEVIATGVDPGVLRVISACLDPDPRRRPGSAIAVAAALPGGDPLAAAVRAGELPSPAMVAAAAAPFSVRKPMAVALAACAIAAMLLVATYSMTINPFLATSDWARAPDSLVDQAKDALKILGYPEKPRHEAAGIAVDEAYLEELRRTRSGADRWTPLREPQPAAASVWWRGSPRSLATFGFVYLTTLVDPPVSDGDVWARVSMSGALLALEARRPPAPGSGWPDDYALEQIWTQLFARAGLVRSEFYEVDARDVRAIGERKRAWEGRMGDGGAPVRVEGSSAGGAVASFTVIHPWHQAARSAAAPAAADPLVLAEEIVRTLAFVGFLAFAFRNLRRRRGDLRAATRLGAFLAICGTAYWLCQTQSIAGEAGLSWSLTHGIGGALFGGVFGAAAYLAIEPFVRKRLPHLLVGSTRLFEGRLLDPVVGRDILAGAAGVLVLEVLVGITFGMSKLGIDVSVPPRRIYESMGLYGLKGGIAELIWSFRLGPTMAAMLVGVFAALFAVLKRRRFAFWLTIVVGGILFAKHWVFESIALQVLFGLLTATVGMFVLVRCGVLGAATFGALAYANSAIPLTFDPNAWYARAGAAYVVAFLVILIWGWRAATAKPPGSSPASGSNPSGSPA